MDANRFNKQRKPFGGGYVKFDGSWFINPVDDIFIIDIQDVDDFCALLMDIVKIGKEKFTIHHVHALYWQNDMIAEDYWKFNYEMDGEYVVFDIFHCDDKFVTGEIKSFVGAGTKLILSPISDFDFDCNDVVSFINILKQISRRI